MSEWPGLDFVKFQRCNLTVHSGSISLPLSCLRLTVLQLRHAPHLVSDTIYSSAAFTMDVHVYVVTEVGSRRQAFNSRNEEGFADPHFSI